MIWGRFGALWAPSRPPNQPQTAPTGPRTTSKCSHMSCSHIHKAPTKAPNTETNKHRFWSAPGRSPSRWSSDEEGLQLRCWSSWAHVQALHVQLPLTAMSSRECIVILFTQWCWRRNTPRCAAVPREGPLTPSPKASSEAPSDFRQGDAALIRDLAAPPQDDSGQRHAILGPGDDTLTSMPSGRSTCGCTPRRRALRSAPFAPKPRAEMAAEAQVLPAEGLEPKWLRVTQRCFRA